MTSWRRPETWPIPMSSLAKLPLGSSDLELGWWSLNWVDGLLGPILQDCVFNRVNPEKSEEPEFVSKNRVGKLSVLLSRPLLIQLSCYAALVLLKYSFSGELDNLDEILVRPHTYTGWVMTKSTASARILSHRPFPKINTYRCRKDSSSHNSGKICHDTVA